MPTATVDEMLAAARGESVRPTSVTASVAEQWAWRVAEREATLEQFAAHVWHLTGTPTPVRPHHGTT